MAVKKKTKRRLALALWLTVTLVAYLLYRHSHPRFIHYDAFGIDLPMRYSIHGIDVSKYQGRIDWKAVRAMNIDGVKLDFVFIKATEGITRQDPAFRYNWERARAAGLLCGAYHYFYSTRDPLLQAENFIRQVPVHTGDLPPVLDLEISNGQPDSVIRRTALAWLRRIEEAYGVKPIIYTNLHFYEAHLGEAFDDYPLWISHYYQRQQPAIGRDWLFWQHHDGGHVDGIAAPVDFNVFRGDSAALRKLCVP